MSSDRTHCTSGCRTGGHSTYGACLRSKNVATTGLESTGPGFSRSTQQSWDKELNAYSDAVKQGIQPATTNMADIQAAVAASDTAGAAFDAGA